jgi:AraC family transcriptional regulator
LLKVMLYIEEHLDENLTREKLSTIACFSPYHFHRIFTAFAGEPVHKYIRRLRLERAVQHLAHTDRPVIHIAMDAGFESHEAFTRIFHKSFGLTPTDLRKRVAEGHAVVLHTRPIEHITYQENFTMDVRIETVACKHIAFIRHIGPYNEIGEAFGQLCAWAGPRGLMNPATECIGIYHDDPDTTPPQKLRSDAAVTVPEGTQGEGNVKVGTLAGGKYAIAIHKGPYNKLIESYRWLYGQWLASSGHEPANAPCFEKYLNNPQDTPEGELLTAIHIPLK